MTYLIPALKYMSVIGSGLFAGASFAVSAMHPAVKKHVSSDGAKARVKLWEANFKRIAPPQAILSLVSGISSICLYFLGEGSHWLYGGAASLFMMPFTILVIQTQANSPLFALNDKVKKGLEIDEHEADHLLQLWGNLHHVRSVVSIVGFVFSLKSFANL